MISGWAQLIVVVVGFSVGGALIALYFLPAYVAKRRHHPKYEQILLFNFLLGWTVVGWVVALVWSRGRLEPEDARPGMWDRLNAWIRGRR
jgi:hypothetical protein